MAKFVKGQSGNPSGRPKVVKAIEELARAHGPRMVAVLFEIATNKRAPHASRVTAANGLLDRGFGRPKQEQNIEIKADLAGALEAMRRSAVTREEPRLNRNEAIH